MKISDLKQFETFRNDQNVKVLRHMDSRLDLWELRGKDSSLTSKMAKRGTCLVAPVTS